MRSISFDHQPNAPRVARALVLEEIGDIRPALARDALLAVSELVSNVLVHTDNGCTVQVGYVPTGFRIEVTDTSADLPAITEDVDVVRPDGRGLAIVNAVAARWGTTVHDHGKTVWAELPVD